MEGNHSLILCGELEAKAKRRKQIQLSKKMHGGRGWGRNPKGLSALAAGCSGSGKRFGDWDFMRRTRHWRNYWRLGLNCMRHQQT